jgi:hypothetical protein
MSAMAPVHAQLVGTMQGIFYINPFQEHPEGLHDSLAEWNERSVFPNVGSTADDLPRDKTPRCRVLLFSSLSARICA